MNISIKEKDGDWVAFLGDGLSAEALAKYENKLAYKAGDGYELQELFIQDDGNQVYYIHKYTIGEDLFEEQDYIIY